MRKAVFPPNISAALPRMAAHDVLLAAVLLSAALSVGVFFGACGQAAPGVHESGGRIVLGEPVHVDLDGDGDNETILVDTTRRLVITDGPIFYRSREKWHVSEAHLGDSDANGLPEVITLLDGPDGRHLGLFGYARTGGTTAGQNPGATGNTRGGTAGGYRELLVTAVLQPRPLSVDVIAAAHAGAAGAGGDLLILTEEVPPRRAGAQATGSPKTTTYRWNGFGFTALAGDVPAQ